MLQTFRCAEPKLSHAEFSLSRGCGTRPMKASVGYVRNECELYYPLSLAHPPLMHWYYTLSSLTERAALGVGLTNEGRSGGDLLVGVGGRLLLRFQPPQRAPFFSGYRGGQNPQVLQGVQRAVPRDIRVAQHGRLHAQVRGKKQTKRLVRSARPSRLPVPRPLFI